MNIETTVKSFEPQQKGLQTPRCFVGCFTGCLLLDELDGRLRLLRLLPLLVENDQNPSFPLFGCGSRPKVPFCGWLPLHCLFRRLSGCSPEHRGLDPWPFGCLFPSLDLDPQNPSFPNYLGGSSFSSLDPHHGAVVLLVSL